MSRQGSNVSREKVSDAWLAAARDLGITVTAPCVLETGEGEYTFAALVHDFGRPKGTLVVVPSDREVLVEAARARGYFPSCLYESYEAYERQLFIDTLNDWQWFGNDGERPDWYTGKPWS